MSGLRENFAGDLSFYGGISTQTVLPYGTPEEVREAMSRLHKRSLRQTGPVCSLLHPIA